MNATKTIKVIVLVDGKEEATAENSVPVPLVSYVTGRVLAQIEDPDTDCAFDDAANDEQNSLPHVADVLNGTPLYEGSWSVLAISYEYPGFVNVAYTDGRSLAFGFDDDDLVWTAYADANATRVIDVDVPARVYNKARKLKPTTSFITTAWVVREVIEHVGRSSAR